MRPDLSILIVNWNTRELLRDCLVSVRRGLRSAEISAEVLVVDNGSRDGSIQMMKEQFPDAVLIANSDNRGFARANNQALERASGRHVLLLNSDTIVHADVLARSVEYLDGHHDVGGMGCRVLNEDGSLQVSTSVHPGLWSLLGMTLGRGHLGNQVLPGGRGGAGAGWHELDSEVLSGCYLMVRREVLGQVGLLDPGFFFFGEETDWCLRIRSAGWRLVFAPVGEITHLGGGSAKRLGGRRDLLLTGALIRLQRKHGGRVRALAMWSLLLAFNASRALYWRAVAAVRRDRVALDRSRHFMEVLAGYSRVWGIAADAIAGAAELDARTLARAKVTV